MYDSCFWWAAFLKHYTACVCVYIYAKYCFCVLVTCFLHSWQARYLSFSFLIPFAGHQVPCPRVTQECICPIHHFIFPDPYTFHCTEEHPLFISFPTQRGLIEHYYYKFDHCCNLDPTKKWQLAEKSVKKCEMKKLLPPDITVVVLFSLIVIFLFFYFCVILVSHSDGAFY